MVSGVSTTPGHELFTKSQNSLAKGIEAYLNSIRQSLKRPMVDPTQDRRVTTVYSFLNDYMRLNR